MQEIALHIMDLLQNSISAGATHIRITLVVCVESDMIIVSIEDNGKGMEREFLERVISPFTTTRTTRKVGLGIPLMKEGCEQAGGNFTISSTPGKGTFLEGSYKLSNIDRPPLGDFVSTVHTAIVCNPDIDFTVEVKGDEDEVSLKTTDIKEQSGLSVDYPDVSLWISEYLSEIMEQTGLTRIQGL